MRDGKFSENEGYTLIPRGTDCWNCAYLRTCKHCEKETCEKFVTLQTSQTTMASKLNIKYETYRALRKRVGIENIVNELEKRYGLEKGYKVENISDLDGKPKYVFVKELIADD